MGEVFQINFKAEDKSEAKKKSFIFKKQKPNLKDKQLLFKKIQ